MLAKVDLTFDDIAPYVGEWTGSAGASYRLKSDEDWAQFWRILNREPLKSRLSRLIESRRDSTRRYFETAGLLDPVKYAIVDFGWSLTTQEFLKRLLQNWGRTEELHGYYLGLNRSRQSYLKAGPTEALFYQRPGDFCQHVDVDPLFRYGYLLEAIAGFADHPTVHHYEPGKGNEVDVAYAGNMSESSLRFCHDLHGEVLAFANKAQSLVSGLADERTCREVLRILMTNFFKNPSRRSLNAIRGLSEASFVTGVTLPIVEPMTLRVALYPVLSKLPGVRAVAKEKCSIWSEGSIMITPPGIRHVEFMASRIAAGLGWIRQRVRRLIGR